MISLRSNDSLPPSNEKVARRLERTADLLEAQHANPFRVGANRNAAAAVLQTERSVHEILKTDGTPV